MGKEWDRITSGDDAWRSAGGFTKPGLGERPTAWPSFGQGDNANATCAICGGRMRGARKCECAEPDWVVKGEHLSVDRRQPGDPTFHPSGVGPYDRAKVRYGYSNQNIGPAMQSWHARWAEAAIRVIKPGGYMLAFGGTRTVHRMTTALEDAGWIVRDMVVWAYAQGFPKSRSTLKPAWEPIVLVRKPGPLQPLAIDECRLPVSDEDAEEWSRAGGYMEPGSEYKDSGSAANVKHTKVNLGRDAADGGRWPANVMLTDPVFDGGVEGVVGGGESQDGVAVKRNGGGISRFFLVPKASRGDREPLDTTGLEARVVKIGGQEGHKINPMTGRPVVDPPRYNTHPTVKPVELMRHLVRLVTPRGGVVLDPFLGSGSTAIAAEMEGFAWLGIEREAEYVTIAEARLSLVQRGLGL